MVAFNRPPWGARTTVVKCSQVVGKQCLTAFARRAAVVPMGSPRGPRREAEWGEAGPRVDRGPASRPAGRGGVLAALGWLRKPPAGIVSPELLFAQTARPAVFSRGRARKGRAGVYTGVGQMPVWCFLKRTMEAMRLPETNFLGRE